MCGIYRILCIKTGKCYIGQTENFNRRYKQHFNLLKNNKHGNKKLQRAVNKYGIGCFKFIIQEEISKEIDNFKIYITEREQYWLDIFDSYKNGYNQTPKAGLSTLGYIFSEETKENISKKARGRIISKETRDKISKKLKNRVFSEEHRKRLSEKAKERMNIPENRLLAIIRLSSRDISGVNNPFFGKHHSEETKEKMSKNKLDYYKSNPCSEELKKKRSENAKGKNNPMYGRKRNMSEETRKKMSEAQKRRWNKNK